MATFSGQAATNNAFTGTSGADLFLWAVANLNNLDRANGAGGVDALRLTTAGALAPTALAGVAGIERFTLAAGGNTLSLANANFTGVAGAKILVTGGAGADTVDASQLTGKNAVDVTAGAGLDVLKGGAGADVFRFRVADLVGDKIAGGAGRDLLLLTTPGGMEVSALIGMTGVETIQLAAEGNGLMLTNANFAGVTGARITIRGSTANVSVDASALTGANAIDVTAGSGFTMLKGGAGRDVFRFAATNVAGTVAGGGGGDLLLLTSGGKVADGGLANMTGVETIKLHMAGNGVTLLDTNFSGVAGAKIVVTGGAGADTVNGAGLTGKNAIDVIAGAGADVLSGGAGRDTFRFKVAGLTGDTVHGNGGQDQLLLSDGGALAVGALTKVDGVEIIRLATAGNAIALVDANFTGVAGGKIVVIGNAGADNVNAQGLAAANRIDVTAGAGADVLQGGAGADVFRFKAGDLAGDTISGGGGSDTLLLTTAGALAADALRNMTGIETIQLAAGGNEITLTDANFAGVGAFSIVIKGTAGTSSVKGAGLTSTTSAFHKFEFLDGGGTDTLVGGANNDGLYYLGGGIATAGDSFDGGAGEDVIGFDRSMNFLGDTIRNVEQLIYAPAGPSNAAVTISGQNAARIAGIGSYELDGVSVVYTVRLAAGSTTNLAGLTLLLPDADDAINVVSTSGTTSVTLSAAIASFTGSAGNDTANGSDVGAGRAITFDSGAGNDVLRGGAGDDVFQFLPTDLTAGDTIAGGAGYDTLQIIRPLDAADRTLATDALAHMTGIDQILLAKTGTGLKLTDANYAVPVTGDVPGSDRIDIYGTSGPSVINAAGLTGTHAIYFYDGNGSDTVIGGNGADVVRYEAFTAAVPGDTFNGGGGIDTILFERSMDFLGDTITNVENLIYFNTTNSDAAVTISSKNAARIGTIGSNFQDGKSVVFTVQLSASGFINLSNLTLTNADAGDAINVVNGGGGVNVTLSAAVTSYTGNDSIGGDYVNDGGGVRAISLGGGNDTIAYYASNPYAAGHTVDGGAGTDAIEIDGSMDFLGDSIINVENLTYAGVSDGAVTISGENAARFVRFIGDFGRGSEQIFTVALSAGSTTDLSKLTLEQADASDAIKVVATSGNTAVTLNNQIASFTGSGDRDTVGYAVGGGYKDGAVISGGGGDDRIVYDPNSNNTVDGGTGNDTLVVLGAATVRLFDTEVAGAGTTTIAGLENVDASASTARVVLQGRSDIVSVLVGGSSGDNIGAGSAGSIMTGGLGSDTLNGSEAEDRFHIFSTAEAAGDTINGQGGDDGIDVLGSADLTGATISGIETLFLAAGDAAGNIINADLTATVTGTQAAALTDIFGNGNNATSVETLVVQADTTSLDLSGLGFFYFDGPDHVEITGTTGNDTITGSSVDDVIHSGGGADTLAGGGGDDVIGYDYFQTSALAGGAGNDTIKLESIDFGGSPRSVRVDLTAGTITEFYGVSSSFGLSATDFENVDFAANVLDADIIGNDGDNVLIGGSGLDQFLARLGADTLTGNGGSDLFQWNSKLEGGDTITDFTHGVDKLAFAASAFGFTNANFDTAYVDLVLGDGSVAPDNVDLILSFSNTFSEAQAQDYLSAMGVDHSVFLIARGDAFHAMLFYADGNPSAGGDVRLIADLGDVYDPDQFSLSDFVFI